jgi:PAS domain S-box-containing protein
MLGTVQDITERYNLEKEREHLLEAVAAEKQWIETIVERSPIGILLFDQHGQVRSNKRADELFGRSIRAEHGREQYVEQLFGLDGRRLRLEDLPYSRVMRGESSEGAEFIIKRPDGSQINVLASAASITDNEGKAIGGVGVFEDITPIRRLEKMREEWVGIVAHDLRQPLTAMASQAELLKMRCSQVGDYAAAFDRFLEAIHRMNQMTKELLDASVIESRRVDLHAARRDLRTLTSDILQRASGLHAEFQFAMPREPIVAFVDPQRYEQILLNLLTNAVKYGRPDRPVEIRLSQSGPYARVSVTNEGEGIAENELPLVFDRYHRAGRGKAKAPGIGLGLYIVKGLVEAHGGAVGVESKPGDKTTFSFTLPVAAVH